MEKVKLKDVLSIGKLTLNCMGIGYTYITIARSSEKKEIKFVRGTVTVVDQAIPNKKITRNQSIYQKENAKR